MIKIGFLFTYTSFLNTLGELKKMKLWYSWKRSWSVSFFLLQTHVTVSKKNTEVIWSALNCYPSKSTLLPRVSQEEKEKKISIPIFKRKIQVRKQNKPSVLSEKRYRVTIKSTNDRSSVWYGNVETCKCQSILRIIKELHYSCCWEEALTLP